MPPKRRGAQAAESQPDEPEPDVEPNVNDKLFTDSLVKGLKDDEVRKALGLKDFENTLAQLVTKCSKLEKTVIDKDAKIILLEKKCDSLEAKLDDLEQWGRRGSMRIQGLPEGPDLVEDKIMKLVNDDLKLTPPLVLGDIEVAHRLPHPKKKLEQFQKDEGIADGTPIDTLSAELKKKLGARSVIVKFGSRRVKSRVMAVRKSLKNLKSSANQGHQESIFFQDDLTAGRAKLAYEARILKRLELIDDTWVWDSKVLIKEKNGRTYSINGLSDLARFEKDRQKKLSAQANQNHVTP